jgi:hypothetical protein
MLVVVLHVGIVMVLQCSKAQQVATSDDVTCFIAPSRQIECIGPSLPESQPPSGTYCAVRISGVVACFGRSPQLVSRVPDNSTLCTQIACGGDMCCALRANDSRPVCWGEPKIAISSSSMINNVQTFFCLFQAQGLGSLLKHNCVQLRQAGTLPQKSMHSSVGSISQAGK